MNLTKKEFIDNAAQKNGITKAVAEKVISGFLEDIAGCLKLGDEITLHGFGKFSVKATAARKGMMNSLTGKPYDIPAGKKVAFKCAKALKDAVQ